MGGPSTATPGMPGSYGNNKTQGPILYPDMEVKNKKPIKTVKDLPLSHYSNMPVVVHETVAPDLRSARQLSRK